MKLLKLLPELCHLIEFLIRCGQVLFRDALNPYEQGGTTALGSEFQQFSVPGHGQARLASPVYLKGDQRLKQLLGIGLIPGDIIIDKDDKPPV